MKRFYFGSSGDEDGDGDEDEAFEMPSTPELISMAQFESPFCKLLESAIRICESNFMWRFLSSDDKAASVKNVMGVLSQMEKEYEDNAQIRDEM